MSLNDVAIRKRNQIARANRTMFIWIAIASALVGAAAVVGFFLAQQLIYQEKVLAEQQNTIRVLRHNNSIVEELQSEILVIDTDQNLAKVKARDTDEALQVILDALPSVANSNALGASLQNKLLTGITGLQPIEKLQVNPVVGIESTSGSTIESDLSETSEGDTPENAISFSFTVAGTQDALKQVLENLERSIRTIQITSLRVESQSNNTFMMTVNAQAFYEPAVELKLTDKAVRR